MVIQPRGVAGKYIDRPPPCYACKRPTWWNGSRIVSCMRRRDAQVVHESGIVRRRACCSTKDCPVKSFTVYEEDSYPHRVFQLVVVASAVAAATIAKQTFTNVAKLHGCSRDSVRRWVAWLGNLTDPRELMRLCTKLEPRGLPGALISAAMPEAAAVLHLLDRLGDLLVERGVKLPLLDHGVARVLKHQLVEFGDVYYLTKVSPPLRVAFMPLRI